MRSSERIGVWWSELRRHKAARWAKYVVAAVLVLVIAGVWFAADHWPYRESKVKALLQGVFSSSVTMEHYSRIYFPHPGFVATGLTLRRHTAPNLPPLGSAKKLLIESNWMDMLLLRKEIRLVRVVGLHVVIPPVGSEANKEDFPPGASGDFRGPSTAVDALQIKDSLLDIMRTNGQRYSFQVQQLIFRHLLRDHAASYVLDMRNAMPSGRLQARGSFGPILPKNLGGTRVSGKFSFSDADLGDVGDLHGTLWAVGTFLGRLDDVAATAKGNVAGFAVGSGQPTDIEGTGRATVNGLTADVVFNSIDVRSGETVLQAHGKMTGSPKVTELDLVIAKGRAQDVLRPFLHNNPPMTGAATLRAHARVAPAENDVSFLHRLTMDGSFDVPGGLLTNPSTEQKLTSFSDRVKKPAEMKKDGEADDVTDTGDAFSSLSADARIRDGVLSSQDVRFALPGASAKLKGTFDLHGGAVNLAGNLRMQHNISHAVTGFKSLLLKPLIPFFRHRRAGAVVPITVTGRPGSYKISQNIFH